MAALDREIRSVDGAAAADTLFFGGGTPSLLETGEVAALIDACRSAYRLDSQAEITLEANPETVTVEGLRGVREAGVTRLSFGVQSFDDGELRRLGRIHSAARAREAFGAARRAGFDNLSLDLMFWLPGQSLDGWLATVDAATALGPEHLSLYLLELYPNAPLKEAMARGASASAGPATWRQSSDDEAADMYLAALDRLDRAGFEQDQISNVARPGRSSRHNVKYWQGGGWRGFGCGAHSTVDGVRWKNVSSTTEYIDRVDRGRPLALETRTLSAQERLDEALFTGLRMAEGIDRSALLARHGVDPWLRYGEHLGPFVEAGLMWTGGSRFGLTRRGMLVSNEILTAFV